MKWFLCPLSETIPLVHPLLPSSLRNKQTKHSWWMIHGLPYLWSTWESARAGGGGDQMLPSPATTFTWIYYAQSLSHPFPLCHLPSSPSTRDCAGKAQVSTHPPKGHEQDACCLPCHTTVCFDDAWSGSVTKSYWAVVVLEHGVKTDDRKVVYLQ